MTHEIRASLMIYKTDVCCEQRMNSSSNATYVALVTHTK